MIIVIWIATIVITIAGCIVCWNAVRINSIISGSKLLEINSATGLKYVQSYNIWKYAAYISLVIIIITWIICIAYNIHKYKKNHVKTKISSTGINTFESQKTGIPIIEDALPKPLYNAGIIIIKGKMQGAEIDMSSNEKIIIGRDPSMSNIILSGAKISRKHCSIQYSQEKNLYRLRCYSKNGLHYSEENNTEYRKKLEKDHVIWVSYNTLVFMPGGTDILKLK